MNPPNKRISNFWHVKPLEDGKSLQAFVHEKLKGKYSLKEVKRQIDAKKCHVNGRLERFGSKKVEEGDKVSFDISSLGQTRQPLLFKPEDILYEDEEILVYNKPAGIICDEDSINKHLASKAPLFLAHRLDKETTGALLLIKKEERVDFFHKAFKEGRVNKTYLAWVDGVPSSSKGKIENFLGKKGFYQGQTTYGACSKSEGRLAVTEWKLLKKGTYDSLLECHPLTGRTHQIRAHLAGMGHPILGDRQYSQHFESRRHASRVLLHAATLRFPHPGPSKEITVEAPLPSDFTQGGKS